METITITTPSKTYPVFVGAGAHSEIGPYIKEAFPALTVMMIITDETVSKLYLSDLQKSLSEFNVKTYIVPSGEKAKTFEVYYEVLSFALENKLDRKSIVLALGGGAVGDLSGFAAATYMRGIPFIQVPTTILAHDSAVGGKVAVNHPLGKNMIGAFHQPAAVFYDLNFLKSLPIHEKRSGFAEVIKHGLIHDEHFYLWLIEHIDSLEVIGEEYLHHALASGIEIKNYFVSHDEKEAGIRAYLNFGHTLGHAIEAEMGYGNSTHGECVLIGMVFALGLSEKYANLSFEMEPFKAWLTKLGYKIEVPSDLSLNKLIERMKQDKKSVGQKIKFVLLHRIGEPALYEISDEELMKELELFQKGREHI